MEITAEQLTSEVFAFFDQGQANKNEKMESLSRFMAESLEKLKLLTSENKGFLFLGFVFEELVRCEPEYYLKTELEKKVESFVFSCLRNQEGYGVLRPGLWHVPDVLGFTVKNGQLCVKRIVEIKTHPNLISPGQIRGHFRDVGLLIERINLRIANGSMPAYIRDMGIFLADNPEAIAVVPRGFEIDPETRGALLAQGLEIRQSIFSIDEAIYIAKKVFPEAGTYWLEYRQLEPKKVLTEIKVELPIVDRRNFFDESTLRLDGFLGFLAAFLQGLFEISSRKTYERKELLEVALIWACCDKIIIDPNLARQIVKHEELSLGRARSTEDLPARFQVLLERVNFHFIKPQNASEVISAIYRIYEDKIEERLEKLDRRMYLEQSVFDFL